MKNFSDSSRSVNNGFTLVEILIVIIVTLLLLFLLVGNYLDFIKQSLIEGERDEIIALLRKGRNLSLNAEFDTSYNVVFSANKYELQKADSSIVTSKTIDSRLLITYSNATVSFDKNSGFSSTCSANCSITVSMPQASSITKSIIITAQGIINEQ